MTRRSRRRGRSLARRSAVGAAAFTLSLLFGAAAALASDEIVIAVHPEITAADFLITLDGGHFAAQGLDVETVTWTNATAMLPLLAHGKVDVSTTSSLSPSYINLIQRGARIRLVASRAVHDASSCPYVAFMARSEILESGRLTTDLASIRGLRIGTDRSAPSFYYWARLLDRAGLTTDDVVLKNVPDDIKAEAIARDLIDVVSTLEPKISRLVASGEGKVWLPIAAATPDRQNTFLMFGPRLLDERRDLGKRVMAAYRAGRAQFLEGKTDRNIEILAARTHMDAEELRRICWPSLTTDMHIDPAGLEDFQRWAVSEKLIDAVVPHSTLVDDSFVETQRPSSPTP